MEEKFNEAASRSKEFKTRPANEELLDLYALYKQATEGNAPEERPGGFDFKAIAKHDAWADRKGLSKEEAMKEYITLVNKLQQQYG